MVERSNKESQIPIGRTSSRGQQARSGQPLKGTQTQLTDIPSNTSTSLKGALQERRAIVQPGASIGPEVPTPPQTGWSERELPDWTPEQQVEGELTSFFNSLVGSVGKLITGSAITLFSGTLGAALLPFFPVGGIVAALGVMAAVTQVQESLKPLDLGLQDDTVRKLVEPLQDKQLNESELRKVIEEVLSKDRLANEDLAKAFIKLLPTINTAAAATTNIEFSGPIQGLTMGNHNTVTQTFEGFLQDGL